jgi:hypothetical protein
MRGGGVAAEVKEKAEEVVSYVSEPVQEIFYDTRVAGAFALGVVLGSAITLISRIVP